MWSFSLKDLSLAFSICDFLSMALPSVTWCSIGYAVLSVKPQFLNCFSSNSSIFWVEWVDSVLSFPSFSAKDVLLIWSFSYIYLNKYTVVLKICHWYFSNSSCFWVEFECTLYSRPYSSVFVIAICDFLSLVFVASATLSFGTCKTASLNCFLQTLHLFNWNLSTCRLCVLSFPSFSEGCLTVLIWSFSLKILSLWFAICSNAKINLIENLWDF